MRLSVTVSALLLAAGCGAEPPDGGNLPGGPDAGAFPNDPAGDRPMLSINQPPAATPYTRVPVNGTGPALGTLIAETATANVAASIGTDGSFCIDIPLQPGIPNTIWFQALDTNGVYSDEIEVTIRQEGQPPPNGNNQHGPEYRNIARFGEILGNLPVLEGDPVHMADGDHQSSTRFRRNWSGGDFLVVKLTEKAPLSYVRVFSDAQCPLTDYRLWITDQPNPAHDKQIWSLVYQVKTEYNDHQLTMPYDIEPTVTGIMLDVSGHKCDTGVLSWPPSRGIHEVFEIEALTRVEQTQPPPPEPSCAGGGVPQ